MVPASSHTHQFLQNGSGAAHSYHLSFGPNRRAPVRPFTRPYRAEKMDNERHPAISVAKISTEGRWAHGRDYDKRTKWRNRHDVAVRAGESVTSHAHRFSVSPSVAYPRYQQEPSLGRTCDGKTVLHPGPRAVVKLGNWHPRESLKRHVETGSRPSKTKTITGSSPDRAPGCVPVGRAPRNRREA